MRQKITLVSSILLFFILLSNAQMMRDGGLVYGNEWINYENPYYKFQLAEDGIYQISYEALQQVGFFEEVPNSTTKNIQLLYMGEAIPIHLSNENDFSGEGYIEFFGQKNRSFLDKYLYIDSTYVLNKETSLFTDTSAYFLTWTDQEPLRYENIQEALVENASKVEYCWQTSLHNYPLNYSQGRFYGSFDNISARYDLGEGYTSVEVNNMQFRLPTEKIYADGPNAIVRTKIFTGNGQRNIKLQIDNKDKANYQAFSFETIDDEMEISASELKPNNLIKIFETENQGLRFRLINFGIIYPRTLNFQGATHAKFSLAPNQENQYIEISQFEHNGVAPILFDVTNNYRITTTIENEVVKANLPPSNTHRELILVAANGRKSVSNLKKRELIPFDFSDDADFDYIILSHPKLIDDESGIIQEYADYRSSAIGGSYNPIIIDVTQVYDQFGYGIDRHEVSIRNFLSKAYEIWDSEHLFILGKGVEKSIMRNTQKRIKEGWDEYDLVPTFGYPHSDYLFVMDNETSIPKMAVGRIAAYEPDQVRIYLDKIKEMDEAMFNESATIEDRAWMKRILHFGGGDAAIQDLIERDLNALKDTAKASIYGADVVSFFKSSTDVVQNVPQSEQVKQIIDNGASLISFFGHSSPTTLDFNIGRPEEYDNKGKYPIFYAIGCNTNRVFDARSTLSEDYVLIKDKGTIGFFGSTWLTQLSNLSLYAKFFYSNLTGEHYGKTIGEQIQETIIDYTGTSSFTSEQIKHVLMFHGDPALRIYPSGNPDFILNVQNSFVDPNLINAKADSFNISLEIMNIGKGVKDSLNVVLNHILPNGVRVPLRDFYMPSPKYSSTITMKLPLTNPKGLVGKNSLEVILDAAQLIDEGKDKSEDNNIAVIPFFVVDNNIRPVFPDDYGIVTTTDVHLKASTINAFAPPLQFALQIDTSYHFDSPLLESEVIEQIGGVLDWQPSLPLIEEQVYYWRISVDSSLTNGEGFDWKSRSFLYQPGSLEGWNQSHFDQFRGNEFVQIELDTIAETTVFTEREIEFKLITAAFPTLAWDEVAVFRDGFRYFAYWNCGVGTESMWITAIDPVTLNGRVLDNPDHPGFNCFAQSRGYTLTANPTKKEDRKRIIDFMQNDVNSDDYVLVFTTQRSNRTLQADQWAADSLEFGINLFQLFEEQGAKELRSLVEKETPYLLIFQKDNPEFIPSEKVAETINDVIEINALLKGKREKGSMVSTIIGPATLWNTFLGNTNLIDESDSLNVSIYGITQEEDRTVLYSNIPPSEFDLTAIDAMEYPKLQLNWEVKDEVNKTPPLIDYWRVHYEGLPDAAIAPNLGYFFHADTLLQGEPLTFEVPIVNTTAIDMDSLRVNFVLITPDNEEVLFTKTIPPLLANAESLARIQLSTTSFKDGLYQLFIEVNPNQIPLEKYAFNNNGVVQFFVNGDKRNPILDVTFDKVRIKNGDIVSSNPSIRIMVNDENPYLSLVDTSVVEVYIRFPSGEVKPFFFLNGGLQFHPSSSIDNIIVELSPLFSQSGTYQLQVEAKDITGNKAGDEKYVVDFQVLLENRMSSLNIFPNPFSESTQFEFTISGQQLPSELQLEIYSSIGELVSVIDFLKTGFLKIGNNKFSYNWNGVDNFGKFLPSGIYFFKISAKTQTGEDYDFLRLNSNDTPDNIVHKLIIIRE